MNRTSFFSIWLLGLIFFSCKSSTSLVAQDSIETLEGYKLWMSDVQSVAKDKLDNIYVIDELNTICKYDSQLKLKYEYSNRQLGTAGPLDVTNPLQMLIYYPDFQIVKTLDNNMSETGSFDLTELDLTDVEAIGLSNDSQIWLYNELDAKLIKVDRSGTVILESDRMDLLFFGKSIHPTQIIERDNLVFLFDPEEGLFIFDNFGQYAYAISEIKSGHIQFHQNQLLHILNGNIDIWNIELRIKRTMETDPLKIDSKNLIFLSNSRIVQVEDRLYVSE